jgi:CRP/FNR family cyclic AMP-dependent transcriptional regulator
MSFPGARTKQMSREYGPGLGNTGNGFAGPGPRLSALSELCGLAAVKVTRYYPRGSVLFVEGQMPRGVYILCAGRAKISIASRAGKTLVLRIAQPGEVLGINPVLTGDRHSATVQTLERCRVDFIPREDLLRLLDRDKRIYAAVAQALSRKLNNVVDHARLLFLSQSAAEKLARLMVKWSEQTDKRTSHGIQIFSGLTHEEIAQMICTSRETVTRLLSDFKRRHLVSLVGTTIVIRNRKALEALAGF